MITFRKLRARFFSAVDNADRANHEWQEHLNTAYRNACSVLRVPELYIPNASITTTANQDYVETDCDVHSIEAIVWKPSGQSLDLEPGQWRGRSRYFEPGETRPPTGTPSHWIRRGRRIYLRPTPSTASDLLITFRAHPPLITSANLDEHMILPPEYDMALVYLAASSYFALHPPTGVGGEVDLGRSAALKRQAMEQLGQPIDPVAEEHKSSNHHIRLQGYRFGR